MGPGPRPEPGYGEWEHHGAEQEVGYAQAGIDNEERNGSVNVITVMPCDKLIIHVLYD